MGVLLEVLGQHGQDRPPRGVVDAFADGNHAAAVAFMRSLHVGQEAVDLEHPLGHVDEVRAVVWELLAQRAGRGQEAGVAAHHDADVNAGQRGVVEVGAGKGQRHEARRTGETRRVVVEHEVVVDRLRDVDAAQRVAGLGGLLGDDAHGVRRVVAADVEEVLDLVRLEHLEHLLAVGQIGFVACAAQRRGGRVGHQF